MKPYIIILILLILAATGVYLEKRHLDTLKNKERIEEIKKQAEEAQQPSDFINNPEAKM